MKNLNQWYEKGMDYNEYTGQMKRNKEEMLSIYGQFQLDRKQKDALQAVKEKNLRVIALTEDWCGDAMLNNPILMKIAEETRMNVRFLLRDENLELMDQYLTNGKSRSIPIYIFIDRQGNEYAVWGPRAPEVQQSVDEERAKLPDLGAPDFKEKQIEMYRSMKKWFLEDRNVWKQVADSIIERICK